MIYERLLNVLNETGPVRVLLVGDFMLDTYLYGNIERISPEAPVMVLKVTERQRRPGGAGSVAVDVVGLAGEVACLGVVGDDANGEILRQMLADSGPVDVAGLLPLTGRPTTCKERIIGLAQHRHQQQLMRIDEECCQPIGPETAARLRDHLDTLLPWCDVVCIEDYNKGVLDESFCQTVITAAQAHRKRVLVDPAAVSDLDRYRGAWLIKPNRRELALATGLPTDQPEEYTAAARRLIDALDVDNVVVTLDKHGALVCERRDGQVEPAAELVPTRARNVYDVTGAGDMVLAVLGMLTGSAATQRLTMPEMVSLANVAGGLEVERFGSVPISRDEIIAELARECRGQRGKLRSMDALAKELQWHRQQNQKIVFTNGCFDILHPGHIGLLSQSKEHGDILVVAINSDASVRALKGPERPILKEQDRAALLAALETVDYVCIFDAPTPIELIERVSPDVLVKGSDWTGHVVGQEWVEAHGGRVVLVPLAKGRSTTNIIEQVIQKTVGRVEWPQQAGETS